MHSSVLLFLNIGSSEMILIVFVALLLFGGEKLPEIARGLGKGIRDFKDASEGVKREIHNQINSFEEKKTETPAANNQLAENNYNYDNEYPSVENTIPVSDPFADNTHPANGEEHTGGINLQKEAGRVTESPAVKAQQTEPEPSTKPE